MTAGVEISPSSDTPRADEVIAVQQAQTVGVPLAEDAARPASAFYRRDTYCAEDSVGYLMRRIVTRLAQDMDRAMEPHGLTNAQWLPLLKLYLGKANTVAELARECELDAGSMTRLLDRIEAKGLCVRVRSLDDRRVVNLELTEAGRSAAQGIPGVLCDAQNALLQGLSHAEWKTLQSLLARVFANAQTAPSSAGKKP